MNLADCDFVSLVGAGYSALFTRVDEKGAPYGIISVGIVGWWTHAGVVVAVQTALGRHHGLAIMGPDGEVTLDGRLFEGARDYVGWLERNLQ